MHSCTSVQLTYLLGKLATLLPVALRYAGSVVMELDIEPGSSALLLGTQRASGAVSCLSP
eukprot:1103800-Amphidinium_carterae.1